MTLPKLATATAKSPPKRPPDPPARAEAAAEVEHDVDAPAAPDPDNDAGLETTVRAPAGYYQAGQRRVCETPGSSAVESEGEGKESTYGSSPQLAPAPAPQPEPPKRTVRWRLGPQLGEGTYGKVIAALAKRSGESPYTALLRCSNASTSTRGSWSL
jgi:hypothetical protein